MRIWISAAVAAATAVLTGGSLPALAADPAGTAVAVTQAASASGAGGPRTLETNGAVFMGDQLTTDAAGLAQLLFRDDTRMVVGPNSELTIDSFVFAGESSAKQVTLNATRGVFRFITGNSPKAAYLIDTPVATIGVRGSHTDFILPGDNTMGIVFYSDPTEPNDGGLYVCDKPELRTSDRQRRHCVEMTNGCNFVVFRAGADPSWVTNGPLRTRLIDEIPFAFRQSGLQAGYHVNSESCDIRSFDERDGGDDSPPAETRQRSRDNGDDDNPDDDSDDDSDDVDN